MKKSLFFLLFFQSFLSFSQSSISVGKPYPIVESTEKYYFSRQNEILSVKVSGKRIVLQRFNILDLSFEKIKVYEDFPKGYALEKVTQFHDKFYVFYSLWNRDTQEEQLFFREIDFEQAAFLGKGEKLFKVRGKVAGTLNHSGLRFGIEDKFNFYFSTDSTRMLIQYRHIPEIKNDDKNHDIIGLKVYDQNLAERWGADVKMPYTEKKMDILDYAVDSESNTYVVTSVFEDNTTDLKDNEGDPNYHLEILKIIASSGEMTQTPVDIEDKFIKTIWLYQNPQGDMVGAGYYNIGRTYENADGVILFKLGKDGKVFDRVAYEIPVEILNQNESGRSQRRNAKRNAADKAEFEDLKLRQVLIEKDGSLVLIGEQYYVKQSSYSSYYGYGRSRTYVQYYYYYNDILMTKIDPSGKLAWMRKLPKHQVGKAGQGSMSYRYIRSGDEHWLLFLDNDKNLILPENKVPEFYNDGYTGFLTAYKVKDINGEVSKKIILNTRDVKGIQVQQFRPGSIISTGPDQFIFEAFKKKKEDILIKVTQQEYYGQ